MINTHIVRSGTSPEAYLHLEALNENIAEVLRRAQGMPIRIATKSIRCLEAITYIQSKSDSFQGLMCYSPHEAAWLFEQGQDDLLLGYPTMDSGGIEKLIAPVKQGKTLTFMVDSVAHLALLNTIGAANDVVWRVCVDVDMSTQFLGIYFGVQRSSIRTVEQLDTFLQTLQSMKHVTLVGLMGYEAQIAGVGDQMPGRNVQNALFQYLKKRAVSEVKTRRGAMLACIASYGMKLTFVNGGGT
ncbi:MAG: alanine racemase, partial [Bacilli bacterium]